MNRRSLLAIFDVTPPISLAFFTLLSYGLLIPWLGLYADDWTFIWTFETLQAQGVLRYFTLGGNRPVWGLFYSLFVPLLGHQPWVWHLFAIFWLWLCAVLVWKLVSLVWPGHPRLALTAGVLFAVYPGLQLQYISLTFGHMWLVYAAFLGSLCCSLLAYRKPRGYLAWSAPAVLLSAVNLLSFEYFIMLELVRPVLLWIVFSRPDQSFRSRAVKTIKAWLPYLLLFTSVLFWRSFLFPLQTIRYQFSLLSELKSEPLLALLSLLERIGVDIFWQSTLRAWGEAMLHPFRQIWAGVVAFASLGILLVAAVAAYLFLSNPSKRNPSPEAARWTASLTMIFAGLIALLSAGPPFWMTGLIVEPDWWNSRFTMPFILGASLLFGGLIWLIPWRRVRWGAAALLVGFAVSSHFQVANAFRVDWINHNAILWQMHWRMPGLQPGTTLLSNDLPLRYFSDNTFSAELNWIQSRGQPAYEVKNYLAYISEMVRTNQPVTAADQRFSRNMISIDFYGSSDQVVGLYYRSGACLRVLDPRYDPQYFEIRQRRLELETENDPTTSQMNEFLAEAARLSRSDLILTDGSTLELDPAIYSAEPRTHWCYFYENAELARQRGDWLAVADFGRQFKMESVYLKRDPMLSAVFIEGYAHAGEIERAIEISRQTCSAQSDFAPVVQRIWQDLGSALPAVTDLQGAFDETGCVLSGH